ncbi:MAG: helix-hairpin-helix domain-containing protein, partial [Acidimicrobiales bacterium]
ILVGGAAAIAAVLAGLWLTRPPAAPAEVSLPFASTTSTTAPASPTSSTSDLLVVHVAGAVVLPGVHQLPAGSRVVDAIEAAGGLAVDADGARLNLAAALTDGERVYVLHVGEDAPPPVAASSTPGVSGASSSAIGPIDLNTADEAALDGLPGVGPATAAAIVAHRTQIGRFTSVDQLLDVRGIGQAKLDAIRDLVRV